MACKSCGTGGSCGTSGGCGKSGGCSSGGCNKMNSYDWLGNMDFLDQPQYNVVEIRFKGGRKEFFRNSNNIELFTGDAVVVEVQGGRHIGDVSLQGELVRIQMQKRSVVDNDEIKQIYRVATDKDIEKFESARKRESATLFRARNIINELKLDMKLTDVEYQADNTKATFYYSAEDRVDFRELIKLLAGEFKIRVEMKQISLRQEAGRLGGIGSCGRELCCSTWLTEFKNVSTSAARYQNLSLNPAKLSGQCGRLKCCLNYELETYMEALKSIPEVEVPLQTQKGNAYLQKTDIFRRIMWFGYKEDTNWYQLSVDRVNEILELNKKGVSPLSLDLDEEDTKKEDKVIKDKIELSRFDDKFKSSGGGAKKKKKKKPQGNNTATGEQRPAQQQKAPVAEAGAQQPRQQPQQPRNPNHTPRVNVNPQQQGNTNTPRKEGGNNGPTNKQGDSGNTNPNANPNSNPNPNPNNRQGGGNNNPNRNRNNRNNRNPNNKPNNNPNAGPKPPVQE